MTDNTFTISEFLYLLRNSAAPAISVETAHRRDDPNANHPNFVFTPASIANYDVLWLFGYEGARGGMYAVDRKSFDYQANALLNGAEYAVPKPPRM